MTITTWANVYVPAVADDAETVIATIPYNALSVFEVVVLFALVSVDTPGADATDSIIRIRRGTITGPIVATPPASGDSGTAAGNEGVCSGPFFDGPGLPSGGAYVCTVEMVGASAPSTGITAVLGIQHN